MQVKHMLIPTRLITQWRGQRVWCMLAWRKCWVLRKYSFPYGASRLSLCIIMQADDKMDVRNILKATSTPI